MVTSFFACRLDPTAAKSEVNDASPLVKSTTIAHNANAILAQPLPGTADNQKRLSFGFPFDRRELNLSPPQIALPRLQSSPIKAEVLPKRPALGSEAVRKLQLALGRTRASHGVQLASRNCVVGDSCQGATAWHVHEIIQRSWLAAG